MRRISILMCLKRETVRWQNDEKRANGCFDGGRGALET